MAIDRSLQTQAGDQEDAFAHVGGCKRERVQVANARIALHLHITVHSIRIGVFLEFVPFQQCFHTEFPSDRQLHQRVIPTDRKPCTGGPNGFHLVAG